MTLSLKKVRALGLSSGGLDSILSALILRDQGIEVEWISFETPFFSSAKARQAAYKTKIPVTIKNITQVYLKMLKNPPCGYGKHMNPCMDCHALMFRLAGKIMKNKGFNFVFSGEVLGQRPMSQTKASLRYVERHSDIDGYILRPLSAKRLPLTIPEKEGFVNRELLLDISGRSRKPQIKLAEKFGITEYPNPAGGCLLTDKGYSARLKDLFEHQSTYTEKELHLLKYGRHLRFDNNTKLIIGRTKQDNEKIIKYRNPSRDTIIKVKDFPGPIVIVPHRASKDIIIKAASICAGYSKAPGNTKVDVQVVNSCGSEIIKVTAISPEKVKELLI
ncbi:MAG: tRNA 4-thiouridine(8) synthase ThiI [Deltaproteobacteria bacterium]|nr:MAG: tRNA 4-thiouridine(8) synthase ThiI [Deltaproteobacteria bacterium]